MIQIVTRCEDCPFSRQYWNEDIQCTKEGSPEERERSSGKPDRLIPYNCPLIDEEITIKLEQ